MNKVAARVLCSWVSRSFSSGSVFKMSNSKFEYVRSYEADDKLLPECWIVVR